MPGDDPRLQGALDDLQAYLSDRLAPLLVADAIETLLDGPPAPVASQLRLWVSFELAARGGSATSADLLDQGLRKLLDLRSHGLVEESRLVAFVRDIAVASLPAANESERVRLHALLAGLAASAPPAAIVAAGGSARTAATSEPGVGSGQRAGDPAARLRFERARGEVAARTGAGGALSEAELRRLLGLACEGVDGDRELEARLESLRTIGVPAPSPRGLIAALLPAVPDWRTTPIAGEPLPLLASTEALRQAVRCGPQRWGDLLHASAAEFTSGAIGRAVRLADLAVRMRRDGDVDAGAAEGTASRAHEKFETADLLRAFGERESWPELCRLADAFPEWSVRNLLDALAQEPDPKRRKLELAMIEARGAAARLEVLARFEVSVIEGSRDPDAWFLQRNLISLLRRIARPTDIDPAHERDLVAPFSLLGHPPPLQREAIQLLGELPDRAGASLLAERQADCERALASTSPIHPVEELRRIQATIVAARSRAVTTPVAGPGVAESSSTATIATASVLAPAGPVTEHGLAGLLERLARGRVSGVLRLRDGAGGARGEVALERGLFVDARSGSLSGEAALFDLFERPAAGRYEIGRAESGGAGAGARSPGRELGALLAEGIRRHDELGRLRLLVSETRRWVPGAAKPAARPGETDGDFLRRVWERVRTGGLRLSEHESELAAGAFRLRAQLDFWIESGALAAAD